LIPFETYLFSAKLISLDDIFGARYFYCCGLKSILAKAKGLLSMEEPEEDEKSEVAKKTD